MEVWKKWIGKKVYVILQNKRVYAGKVVDVSEENNGICFLTIIDKFEKRISFVNSEIELIQEEEEK